MLKCTRGTNDVEATHRVINKMLGTSSCGEEFAHGWAAERRHRYNHDTAVHTRQGYVKTGHYKHWLVDRRQQLWYAIIGKQYSPQWINALEMADTPERFGIVPLSSVDLQVPLQDPDDLKMLSPDLRYMARQMQCPLPPRPVQQRPEQRLFTKLYYEKYRNLRAINFRRFADDWNVHASVKNGVMPKLPVHLRLYFKQFLFNSRLKEMLRSDASVLTELRTVLESHDVTGIRVDTPSPMQRPVYRVGHRRGHVDIGTHRYSDLQSQMRRDASAEPDELAGMDMDAGMNDDPNTQQERDDEADVHGGADGNGRGEDGGAEARKRRKKRMCALCRTVSTKLSPDQIRKWLGVHITLRPDKCTGKGNSRCKALSESRAIYGRVGA